MTLLMMTSFTTPPPAEPKPSADDWVSQLNQPDIKLFEKANNIGDKDWMGLSEWIFYCSGTGRLSVFCYWGQVEWDRYVTLNFTFSGPGPSSFSIEVVIPSDTDRGNGNFYPVGVDCSTQVTSFSATGWRPV